jgi:hypothetical protein
VNWGILLGVFAAIGTGSISAWGLLAVGSVAGRFRRFRYVNPAQMFHSKDDEHPEAFTVTVNYTATHFPKGANR